MADGVYGLLFTVREETRNGVKVRWAVPQSFEPSGDTPTLNLDSIRRQAADRRERSTGLVVLGPYQVDYDDEVVGKSNMRDRSIASGDVAPPPDGFFDNLRKSRKNRIDG